MNKTPAQPGGGLAAQGFVPGIALRLRVGRSETLSTMVEFISDERVEVLVPIHRLRPRSLSVGTLVHGEYSHQRKVWQFVTAVLGHSPDGLSEYLAMPETITCREQRAHFRLPTSIQLIAADLVREDPAGGAVELLELRRPLVVDLSEGGLCLSSQSPIARGDRLQLRASLGESGEIAVEACVLSVEEPREGYRNRKAHCRFLDIPRSERDRIARFLMRRQIELRKGGKL